MENRNEDEIKFESDDLRSRTVRLSSMNRIPSVPDMTGKLMPPRRASPFILDDFRGSNAYSKNKP